MRLNCEAASVLTIDPEAENKVLFEGQPFTGNVIFTGALDELFGCRFGRLPYRSLRFDFEHYDKKFYQSHGVVNYTVSEDFTRITEFKYLSGQLDAKDTTIVKEYPMPYQGKDGEIPYYAINKDVYKRQRLHQLKVRSGNQDQIRSGRVFHRMPVPMRYTLRRK